MLTTWSFLCISLSIIYSVLLIIYVFWWSKLNNKNFLNNYKSNKYVTIVVPARNEEANIDACLSTLFAQNYPQNLYEVILVNDFSEDNTLDIANSFIIKGLKVIDLKNHFSSHESITAHKKTALALAIAQSRGEVILTTDADCLLPPNWIKTMLAPFHKSEVVFVTGPVVFDPNITFLQKIVALDFCGMMVTTGASVISGLSNMSNGANLGYLKSAFETVNGFEGINHLASGDDLLLMEKMTKHYGMDKVAFVKSKEAVVSTLPPENLNAFINQRIRWASKSTAYSDVKIKSILILVWLSVFCILLNGLLSIFYTSLINVLMIQLLLKIIADFILLWTGTHFFKKNRLLWLFLPAQIFHILYIVSIGFLGNIKKYEWKGRVVR